MRQAHETIDTLVDEYGSVYDLRTIPKRTYLNGDGYVTVLVRRPDGRQETVAVHTLVANTFLPEEKSDTRNQVNHRDLCKTNNSAENLEWVTQEENNIHEDVMTNTEVKPKVLVTWPDGTTTLYRSIDEACEKLFRTRLVLWDAIKHGKFGGLKVKYLKTADVIPDEHKLSTVRGILGNDGSDKYKVGLIARDLDTGSETSYPSMNDLARELGISASHVFQCIATKHRLRLLKKRYLIWRDSDEYPGWNNDDIERARTRGSRDVLAYSMKNGTFATYESASKFVMASRASKKRITTDLANGTLRWTNGYVYTYLDDTAEERLIKFIGCPDPI